MASGFQQSVGVLPAPGIEGDFCDSNPRFTLDAGAGALVAGLLGVTMGRFAWSDYSRVDNDNAPAIVNTYGSGPVAGFVHNAKQGLITPYLARSGMLIPSGFPVTVFVGGGFWIRNNGTTAARRGQKCYARHSDGAGYFGASGAAGASVATAWGIAPGSAAFTGSISGNVLNVSAVASGTLYPGAVIAGGSTVSGTEIVGQLSGTPGGVGQYSISIPEQTSASGSMTASYGTLTLTTVSGAGKFGVGDTLTGASAGVTGGTRITDLLTGDGTSGSTAIVNLTQTSGNGGQGDLSGALGSETKWVAQSDGAAGELVKISDYPLG